jgi:HEAT repeat protein
MAVSMHDVTAALMPEEPDYEQAAQLGPEALPHLATLVQTADSMLASKAVYLASLIPDPQAEAILLQATESGRPEVRVAAAAGARNLGGPAASDVLVAALSDADSGVRKVALKSVPMAATPVAGEATAVGEAGLSPELRAKVAELTTDDPEPFIRDLSREVLEELPAPNTG